VAVDGWLFSGMLSDGTIKIIENLPVILSIKEVAEFFLLREAVPKPLKG
jgi:hypothetical protein